MDKFDESSLVLRNANVVDVATGTVRTIKEMKLSHGVIEQISVDSASVETESVPAVDLKGLFLLPGLIDCHVHATAMSANFAILPETSPSYVTAKAAISLKEMLQRGFTTVRDVGGADYGLASALEEGLFEGPRLMFGGPALSQTGGHGDIRGAGRHSSEPGYCFTSLGVICDGEAEVRRTARDILRTGAHHLKLMLSGGVASPTDRVSSTQFSVGEIRAAVEEAEAAGRYVTGHAYTARAINRALIAGVRCIEHGNLLDEESCLLFREHDAFLVPTLITYQALTEEGRLLGMSESSVSKVDEVLQGGYAAVSLAYKNGVKMAFGTDLLGAMQRRQSEEFTLLAKVLPASECIRSATIIGAELLGLSETIGQVLPGYSADLIAVDGNPLDDITFLADPEKHLKLVIQNGKIVLRREI